MEEFEATGLRLLVLDGGDIRCLSQLDILDELFNQIQWKRNSEEVLLPCRYFNMICASGPAGIIVVLFVVFQMSIQEARDEFIRIWKEIFLDDSYSPEKRSEQLNKTMEALLEQRNMPLDRKLLQRNAEDICKGFVCVVAPESSGACQKLRTYYSPQRGINVSVVQAARATCARLDKFTSVKVSRPYRQERSSMVPEVIQSERGLQEFISGETILPNPTREAIKELHDMYGPDRRMAFVLSLGCGRPAIVDISRLSKSDSDGSFAMYNLQADIVANELEDQIGRSGVYYRFSVDRGLESSGSMGLSSLGTIETHTRVYLQQSTTVNAIQSCITAAERTSLVTTKDIFRAPTPLIAATYGLPPLCASFVMRQELLDSMARAMFEGYEGSQRIMVLSGMGGSGKTQIVAKFARAFSHRFHYVLFINASTTDNIKSELIDRVHSIGGSGKRLEEALAFLAHPDRSIHPCLVIFDNVDDPDIELAPFIPRCDHGFVIVTTRNPTQANLSPNHHIKVDIMSESEALDALILAAFSSPSEASKEDREHGLAIVKELGYLPVAIVQAGSFIKQRRCMNRYLAYLQKNRVKLLTTVAKGQIDIHHHGIYSTLDVTLPFLTPVTQQLLGLLGCFNYAGFPLSLIERAANRQFLFEPHDLLERSSEIQESADFLASILLPQGVWDQFEFDGMLLELEQYSLVLHVQGSSGVTLRFHPLVHSWIVDRLTMQRQMEYEKAALRLLICGTSEADEDLYQQLLPHLTPLASTWEIAEVNDLAGVARLLRWEGKFDQALGIWDRIRQAVVQRYGDGHLRTSRAELQLAMAQPRSGVLKAYWSIISVIGRRERALLPDHPEISEAITGLAELELQHKLLRQNDRTLLRLRHVVEVLRQSHQKDTNILRLKAMEVLAQMCHIREQWEEASALLLEVLECRVQIQGSDHLMTLRTKSRIAHLEAERTDRPLEIGDGDIGDIGKIEEVLIDIVRQRKEVQGTDHPDTLKAQGLLADFCEQYRLFNRAIITRKEVVEGWARRNGRYDLSTIIATEFLAKLCQKAERYDQDVVFYWTQVIEGYRQTKNPLYYKRLEAMESRAKALGKVGQYDDAVIQWERVIEVYKTAGNENEERVFSSVKLLTSLQEKYGRHDAARARWKQFIDENKATGNPRVFVAMALLSRLFERAKMWEDAISQRKQLVEALLEKEGPHARQTLEAMETLARILEKSKKYDEAISMWEQLIAASKTADDFQQTINSLNSLILLHHRLEDGYPNQIITLREQVADLYREKEGPNSPHTLDAVALLATIFQLLARNKDSLDLWEQVREARLSIQAPLTFGMLDGMLWHARLLWETGEHARAMIIRLEVINGYSKLEGSFEVEITEVKGVLATNIFELQRRNEAIPVLKKIIKAILEHKSPYFFDENMTKEALLDACMEAGLDRPAPELWEELGWELVEEKAS